MERLGEVLLRERSWLRFRYLYWLLALFALWVGLNFESLRSAMNVWENSNTFTHCYFVIPLSLYLIYLKRSTVLAIEPAFDARFLVLFLPLVPVLMFAYAGDIDLLMHMASFSMLPVMIAMAVGWGVARQILFPLCFMLFSIPVGEELVPLFQRITADLSVALLGMFGIPVFREGLYIQIPEGKFLVAEACSGIRFFVSTIMLGALYAYLLFNKTHKRILFMIFAIALPIIANAFRAFGIMLVGHLTDMKHAVGADHLVYGWVFFALVTGLLIATAYAVRDKQETLEEEVHSVAVGWTLGPGRPQAITMLLLFVVSFAWLHQVQHRDGHETVVFPDVIGLGEVFSPEVYNKPRFPSASKAVHLRVSLPNVNDMVTHIYMHGSSKDSELTSSANRLYDPERWTLDKQSTMNIAALGGEVLVLDIVSNRGERKRLLHWYRVGAYLGGSKIRAKLAEAFENMLGRAAPGVAVVVSLDQHANTHAPEFQLWMKKIAQLLNNVVEGKDA